MPLTNNVMIVRHKLLTNLIKLWKDNQLVERIDRLPIELSPRTSRVLGRCCVHKERAVWKYKSFPLMGFDMSDETDELTPLSEYARKALERKGQQQKDNILCVIDEACSSCVQTNYEITNLCKGCVARACATNCPKNAIEFNRAGKAVINHDLCISCGICHSNCPYHAIVYMPVPCEEACPVKAITKDERGVEHIDESKCIYCGKCINSCPFGAIFEVSQVFDVLQRLREGEKMVAVVAPAILGQYNAPTEKVYGAIKAIGFEDVIEVAQGAMETIRNEGAELEEKIEEGQAFMTTSCCPSWVELANKHIPEMKPFISSTGSPMYYAARIAKEKHPDAQVVFIGPCVAKRKEARRDECVDFVMTFEEINSIFDGLGIEVETTDPFPIPFVSTRAAHGFAQAGGVMGAVQLFLADNNRPKVEGIQVSNLNKKNVSLLRAYAKSAKPRPSSSRSWPAKADVSRVPAPTTCTMPVNGNSRRNWLNAKSDGAMKELVDQLKRNRTLSPEELRLLLTDASPEEREYLHRAAREVAVCISETEFSFGG